MIRHAMRVGTLSGRLTPVLCGSAKEYHGVRLLRLETGIYQQEAIGLYERMGFSLVWSVPGLAYFRHDRSCFLLQEF